MWTLHRNLLLLFHCIFILSEVNLNALFWLKRWRKTCEFSFKLLNKVITRRACLPVLSFRLKTKSFSLYGTTRFKHAGVPHSEEGASFTRIRASSMTLVARTNVSLRASGEMDGWGGLGDRHRRRRKRVRTEPHDQHLSSVNPQTGCWTSLSDCEVLF